jgi:hypothetical protein
MSQVNKTLNKWRKNPPTDAPKDEVLAIIKRFFAGQYRQTSGSHVVIQDDRLIGIDGYGPAGDFDVPIKGGQRVKGVYLRKLALTIELLEETER